MKRAEIEAGVVGLLLALDAGVKPHTGEMRREIGCTVSELGDVIQSMRWRGKIEMDRLALSASMRADAEAARAAPPEEEQQPAELLPVGAGNEPEADEDDDGSAPDLGGLPPVASQSDEAPASAGMGDGGADAAALPSSAAIPDEAKGAILLAEIEDYCTRTGTKESKIGAVLFRHPGYVGLLRKRGSVRPEAGAAVRALLAEHPDGLDAVEAVNSRMRVPSAAPDPLQARRGSRRAPAPSVVRRLYEGETPIRPPAPAAAAARAERAPSWESAAGLREEIEAYLARTGTSRTVFGVRCANDSAMITRLASAANVSGAKAARARGLMASNPDGIEVVTGKRRCRIPVPHDEQTLAERFTGALVESPEDMIRAVQRTHDELWQRVILLGRSMKVRPGQALYIALGAGLDCLEEVDDG